MRAKPAVPVRGSTASSTSRSATASLRHQPRAGADAVQSRARSTTTRAGRSWESRPGTRRDPDPPAVRLAQPCERVVPRTEDAVLRHLDSSSAGPPISSSSSPAITSTRWNYGPFVAAHRRHRADVTIAGGRFRSRRRTGSGSLALDDGGPCRRWQEEAEGTEEQLASMGIYVFSKRALAAWLDDAAGLRRP